MEIIDEVATFAWFGWLVDSLPFLEAETCSYVLLNVHVI